MPARCRRYRLPGGWNRGGRLAPQPNHLRGRRPKPGWSQGHV